METKKQKIIKVLKRIGIALSVGFNVIFLIAIIIGSSGIKNKGNNVQVAFAESEVIKVDSQVNKKFVSYNDETYSITLSSDELNNYVFYNLYYQLYSNISSTEISFTYLSELFTFSDDDGFSYIYDNDDSSLQIFLVYDYINFNLDYSTNLTKNYVFYISGNDGFINSLIIVSNSGVYSDVKNAIESDIQANESNINGGIFETLTSGVVAFIGSIGSGITAMTSVFYDSSNSQLTTIGLLSVIVVAITLSYFLFRLIIGLIRMRG